MTSLKLVLPFPCKDLLPNKTLRGNWRSHFKQTAELRLATALTALAQKPKGWTPLESYGVELTFYAPDRRGRDRLNLAAAAKAMMDGLQPERTVKDKSGLPLRTEPGAGIIAGDSEEYFTGLFTLHPIRVDKRNPRSEWIIQEMAR